MHKKTLLIGLLTLLIVGCTTTQSNQDTAVSSKSSFSSSQASSVVVDQSAPTIMKLPNGWSRYRNEEYGIQFDYPGTSDVQDEETYGGRIVSAGISVRQLPDRPEGPADVAAMFYVYITTFNEGENGKEVPIQCPTSMQIGAPEPKTVTINGTQFHEDLNAASMYLGGMQTNNSPTAYCTIRNNKKFTIVTNISYPRYDFSGDIGKEEKLAQQTISTFTFLP